MRTTLTIDDDVAEALQREQRRSQGSFKDVVNRALRAGLSLGAEPAQRLPPFEVEAKACGFRPGVDPERLNQLVDELQADDFLSGEVRRSP